MKELIDRLSLGMIEREHPKITADVEEILLVMMPGEQKEGSIVLRNYGDGKLKGVVYSSNRHVKIKNQTFAGSNQLIRYTADARYLQEDTTIKGEIGIVSNGGELKIPFELRINVLSAKTSLGEIRNLFHFTDLVQEYYEEALKLFCSNRFAEIFLRKDYTLRAKYHALVQGADKKLAMEEFLIIANKKKPVVVDADCGERVYEECTESLEEEVLLTQDGWGYFSASVESEGVFIVPQKTILTSWDFGGKQYRLFYRICEEKMHEGWNYGYLKIRSVQWEIEIPIRAYKPHGDKKSVLEGKHLAFQRELSALYHCYLEFRMKKIPLGDWQDRSMEAVKIMSRLKKGDVFVSIVRAQLMLSMGKENEAGLLLEEVSRQLQGSFNRNVENYCFYLYVKALKEKDEAVTKRSLSVIREYYEQGYDQWQLLWLMMYLDVNYDRNESLKLIRMKEQYDKGMRSPLLYYETVALFNETPSLLRVLDQYEYQALLFGLKYQYLSRRLCDRILDLCSAEKKYQEPVYRLLTGIYELYPDKQVLSVITGMLIKGAKTDTGYFPWYQRAVEADLQLTGLYEYYMYSMSYDYRGRIPNVIYMYFVYNLTLKGERLDFLYCKVLESKAESEQIYQMYEKIIRSYVETSLREGRINDKLAVLYQEFLPDVADRNNIDHLAAIVNTYKIQCADPDIREAIVIYKEMEKETHVPFVKGKAYVPVYSSDAAVVFEDVHGNRFLQTVSYQKKKLLQMEELLLQMYHVHPDKLGLLIYLNDMYFKYRKFSNIAIEVMERLVKVHNIRPEYRVFLEKEIIEYHAADSDEEAFKNYLSEMETQYLRPELLFQIMGLCITRGLPKRAYEIMKICGVDYADSKLLFKCMNEVLETSKSYEPEMVEFSLEAFRRGKYNEMTLNLLGERYFGPTKEMLKLWRAIKNFDCESRRLEEQLVVQMMFTGEYSNHLAEVFESYLSNGANEKVKAAYFIRKSYDYFVKETVVEKAVFSQLYRAVANGGDLYYMCKLALLKYWSEQETLEEAQILLAEKLLYEMCGRNKIFEFYKKFQKYFPIPEDVACMTFIEYRTEEDKEVSIYYLAPDREEFQSGKMNNICHGIFTFPYLLFYGEQLKYYIKEREQGQEHVTESREIAVSREHTWNSDSVYGILNDMMVCSQMREEQSLNELAKEYYIRKLVNQNIFTLC